MSTVSILIIKLMVQYLLVEGYDIKKLFELANEDISMLDNPEFRVTEEQIDRIYQASFELTGDPSVGFKSGLLFKFNSLGFLGYFLENSSTGQDVYDKLIKYQSLLGNGIMTEIEMQNNGFLINLLSNRNKNSVVNRICMEKIITQNILGMRMLTNNEFDPISVFFNYPKPENTEEFEKFVACPVIYESDVTGILMPKRILTNKIIQYDKSMEDQFSTLVRDQLAKLYVTDSISAQISQHIFQNYPSCKVEIEKVASDFNIGLRTLQRRLQQEDTNFKNIIDEVKKRIAINYVQSNILALSEISYLMGFSEISSFYRSFKRWTGQTPKMYRMSLN